MDTDSIQQLKITELRKKDYNFITGNQELDGCLDIDILGLQDWCFICGGGKAFPN